MDKNFQLIFEETEKGCNSFSSSRSLASDSQTKHSKISFVIQGPASLVIDENDVFRNLDAKKVIEAGNKNSNFGIYILNAFHTRWTSIDA